MERKKNTYVGRSCAHTSSLTRKKLPHVSKSGVGRRPLQNSSQNITKTKNMLRKTSSIFCKEKGMMNKG
jgi:hypothetical protein